MEKKNNNILIELYRVFWDKCDKFQGVFPRLKTNRKKYVLTLTRMYQINETESVLNSQLSSDSDMEKVIELFTQNCRLVCVYTRRVYS